MSVYSVMLTDEDIVKEVGGVKNLVILGCTNCANTSIAYDKNLPVNQLSVDTKTGQVKTSPVAIIEEANRLKAMFSGVGIITNVEMKSSVCAFSGEYTPEEVSMLKTCAAAEAIVVLSCPAGIMGIKRQLGKDVKVLPGMRTEGLFQRCTFIDREKGLVYIDKTKSTIINLFK